MLKDEQNKQKNYDLNFNAAMKDAQTVAGILKTIIHRNKR